LIALRTYRISSLCEAVCLEEPEGIWKDELRRNEGKTENFAVAGNVTVRVFSTSIKASFCSNKTAILAELFVIPYSTKLIGKKFTDCSSCKRTHQMLN